MFGIAKTNIRNTRDSNRQRFAKLPSLNGEMAANTGDSIFGLQGGAAIQWEGAGLVSSKAGGSLVPAPGGRAGRHGNDRGGQERASRARRVLRGSPFLASDPCGPSTLEDNGDNRKRDRGGSDRNCVFCDKNFGICRRLRGGDNGEGLNS